MSPPRYAEDGPKTDLRSPWPLWVSAVSQILMLVVVAGGYFFTVRPIFQHQLLQEKNAQLELNERQTRVRLEALDSERNEVLASLDGIQRELEAEQARRQAIAQELEAIERAERAARERVASVQRDVATQLQILESARWYLVLDSMGFSGFFRSMFNTSSRSLEYESAESLEASLQDLVVTWPNIYESLRDDFESALNRQGPAYAIPESFRSEFLTFLESRKANLTCPSPNVEELVARYRIAMADAAVSAEKQAIAYLDELKLDASRRGRRVEITDQFARATRASYLAGEKISVRTELSSAVSDLQSRCQDVYYGFITEFRNLKNAPE